MSGFQWLTGLFSNRGKAMSLYKRGMAKATKRDHEGAIDDYNQAITLPDTPPDLKAMVLYNRALAYFRTGQKQNAMDDLKEVLEMDEAPASVKSKAKEKLMKKEKTASS